MKQGLILGITTLVIGLSVAWAAWDGTMPAKNADREIPAQIDVLHNAPDSTTRIHMPV